jgi:hypothetical protein
MIADLGARPLPSQSSSCSYELEPPTISQLLCKIAPGPEVLNRSESSLPRLKVLRTLGLQYHFSAVNQHIRHDLTPK